jgi:uncharacterized protein DUF4136
MTHRPAVTVAVAVLVAAGCGRYHVRTDWQPGTDFTRLGTYAWRSRDDAMPRDPRVDNDLFETRVRDAVDDELRAKGYRLVDGPADFEVAWDAWIQPRSDVTAFPSWGFGFGGFHGGPGFWGLGVGSDIYVDQYDEGTLILDVLDPATGRLLWRGSAESRLRENGTPEERTRRVRDAVHAILERFPPPAPKATA